MMTNLIKRATLGLAFAAAGAGLALPAVAVAKDKVAPTKPAGSGDGAGANAATKYCVVTTPTGSMLRQKTCHTREAWMEKGFDPLATKK